MSCSGCTTGRGTNNLPGGCKSNGSCGTDSCTKLSVFDWLENIEVPGEVEEEAIYEIRFKNDRKGFFKNVNKLPLIIGDVVAVEASPGHDIGVISMKGELVHLQMKKRKPKEEDIKKIYRKVKKTDVDKWQDAIALEKDTLQKARQFAIDLGLQMKIGDVEFQGDKTKATFYYTADGRVDFRELIKVYAQNFKVRIEMRQIGARQEASKLGGVGACGRELCCATWLSDFRSVTTTAARYQQLALNPQKLAGQCGKLKCCLNFELDSYLDAIKDFPSTDTWLKTKAGTGIHVKTDIFSRTMYYILKEEDGNVFYPVDVDTVHEILAKNKEGVYPETFIKEVVVQEAAPDYENVVGEDDLTRFDSKLKSKKKGKRKNNNNKNRGKKPRRNPNNNGPQNSKK